MSPVRAAAPALITLGLLDLTQAAAAETVTIDAVSDERRRGLSWSGSRASTTAAVTLDPAANIRLDGGMTALRGARRHGGADAVVDLGASLRHRTGAFRLDLGALAHVFAGGAGRLNYAEAQAGAGTTLGPFDVDFSATYAPPQAAIGGDALYLAAGARVAILGSPFSLAGGIGHSSGHARRGDPAHAARLRPAGDYADWRLGIEHRRGPLALSLAYVGNTISKSSADRFTDRGRNDALVAKVALML